WISGSSPSRKRSRIAAWAWPLLATRALKMPSNAQRPPPRAFAFAIQTEGRVMRILSLVLVSALALSACNDGEQSTANQSAIQVRSNEQDQLRTLDALNLAIALKHAIY